MDVVVLNFREINPTRNRRKFTEQKKNKILAASQTDATAWIAPKICQTQPPKMYSQCSRFHPNPFTFDGVIAARVNTVFCPVEYFHNSPEAKHSLLNATFLQNLKMFEEYVADKRRSAAQELVSTELQ